MNETAINKVGTKLKVLPDAFLKDVENYLDYLTFKHKESSNYKEIPSWQKEIVLNRLKNPKEMVDAFEMIDELKK